MPTVFDRLQRDAVQWLADLDAERDRAAGFIARYGSSPALDAWLDEKESERAKHVLLMDALDELRRQNHPFLLLQVRPPKMLKAQPRDPLRTVRFSA